MWTGKLAQIPYHLVGRPVESPFLVVLMISFTHVRTSVMKENVAPVLAHLIYLADVASEQRKSPVC